MITKSFNFLYKNGERFNLVALGDVHIGNKASDKKRFEQLVKTMADNEYYWIGMGDLVDSIVHTDKRFDYDVQDKQFNSTQEQLNYLIEIFTEIKDNCLGLVVGNHEDVYRRKTQFDLIKLLCEYLKTNYLSYNALLRFVFDRGSRKRRFDVFVTHGSGSAITNATKINKLEKLSNFIEADLYLMGHFHVLLSFKKVLLCLDNKGNLIEKEKNLVLTGGFLKGYDVNVSNYVEKRHLQPATLGSPFISIEPENLGVEVHLDAF